MIIEDNNLEYYKVEVTLSLIFLIQSYYVLKFLYFNYSKDLWPFAPLDILRYLRRWYNHLIGWERTYKFICSHKIHIFTLFCNSYFMFKSFLDLGIISSRLKHELHVTKFIIKLRESLIILHLSTTQQKNWGSNNSTVEGPLWVTIKSCSTILVYLQVTIPQNL